MAKGNMSVTVSVEAAAHKAIREVAEVLFRDHGVMIDGASLDWSEQINGDAQVVGVQINTRTRGVTDPKRRPPTTEIKNMGGW